MTSVSLTTQCWVPSRCLVHSRCLQSAIGAIATSNTAATLAIVAIGVTSYPGPGAYASQMVIDAGRSLASVGAQVDCSVEGRVRLSVGCSCYAGQDWVGTGIDKVESEGGSTVGKRHGGGDENKSERGNHVVQ